jgi:hypothetical protein
MNSRLRRQNLDRKILEKLGEGVGVRSSLTQYLLTPQLIECLNMQLFIFLREKVTDSTEK